jgi:hypothetical protein
MKAPANSYWSIEQCRWVRYAPPVEIPDQRDADEPVATPAEKGSSVVGALADGTDGTDGTVELPSRARP